MAGTGDSLGKLSGASAQQAADLAQRLIATSDAMNVAQRETEESKQATSDEKLRDLEKGNSPVHIAKKELARKQEIKKDKVKQAQESVLIRKEDADDLAGEFSQRQGNREYQIDPRTLSQIVAEELGAGINENSDPDTIIALIQNRMSINGQPSDVSVIDKAFEFLIEVSSKQMGKVTGVDKERLSKIVNKIENAKIKHFDANAAAIQVAQKIIGAADALSTATGETLKLTLDRCRDIVHNPPDIQTLRKYFEAKGYKVMIVELKSLSSYLGGNFKRSNIENPELAQLARTARQMQALLGVYRQTKTQMRTLESYLELNGILAAA